MAKIDLDFSQFSTYEEALEHLDANAFTLARNNQTTNFLIQLRDWCKTPFNRQKAQIEVDCSLFHINGLDVFSLSHSYRGEEKDFQKYPDFNHFQKDAFKYLTDRAKTNSPALAARYNHLLWKGPKRIKNQKYALEAVKNYIKAIEVYIQLFHSKTDGENLFQVSSLFEPLCQVSAEIKQDHGPLKALSRRILLQETGISFWVKAHILEEMVRHPRLFKKDDFEGCLQIYRDEFNRTDKRTDFSFLADTYFPTAIKIAQKRSENPNEWFNMMGQCYLRIAEEETDQSRFWIKQEYHSRAVDAFLKAGDSEMKAKAERLYFELKPKISLPSHEFTSKLSGEDIKGLKEEDQKEQEWVEKLLNDTESDKIYGFLAMGVFFPTCESLLKSEGKTSVPWLKFGTSIVFDENKNIRKTGSDDDDYVQSLYLQLMHTQVLRLVSRILHGGIEKGVLTYENFVKYLQNKTWLGKTYLETDLGGIPIEQNWIGLIAPSVIEYFLQTKSSLSAKYYEPNYVLCIDSLVLKFEGLLRNFASRLSVPTSTTSEKGMREVYIHELLAHEVIRKYFSEDDLYLFKFLFTDQGINLRNKVAHCFQKESDYTEAKMIFLILALLRIGKYNFK